MATWHPTHLSCRHAHSDRLQTMMPDLVLVTRADQMLATEFDLPTTEPLQAFHPSLPKGLAHLPTYLSDPPTDLLLTDLLVTDLPTTTAGEL